ncbi:MAG: hypothetical protein SRB2_02058 [Desulfobacteraceae bacterium Eth-SRB2]|nr:MAG: hypothetical protein SRB2_02058 [Desulfobacteraceae bacterium Eth-SRB2]
MAVREICNRLPNKEIGQSNAFKTAKVVLMLSPFEVHIFLSRIQHEDGIMGNVFDHATGFGAFHVYRALPLGVTSSMLILTAIFGSSKAPDCLAFQLDYSQLLLVSRLLKFIFSTGNVTEVALIIARFMHHSAVKVVLVLYHWLFFKCSIKRPSFFIRVSVQYCGGVHFLHDIGHD